MKLQKILSLALALMLSLSLVSCGGNGQNPTTSGNFGTVSSKNDINTTEASAGLPQSTEPEATVLKPTVETADGAFIIEQGDRGGETVIFDEKILTIEELFSCITKVELTPDNFFDYFQVTESQFDEAVVDSVFADEIVKKVRVRIELRRNPDIKAISALSSQELIAARFSYQLTEEICNKYSMDNTLLSSEQMEINSDTVYLSESFYYSGIPVTTNESKTGLILYSYKEQWKYDSDNQIFIQYLRTISDPVVEKVQGNIYLWKEIPEEYWNITPGGCRYVAVQTDDGVIRLIEYFGGLYSNNYFVVTCTEYGAANKTLDELIDTSLTRWQEARGYSDLSKEEFLLKMSDGIQIWWPSDFSYNYGFTLDKVK